MAPRPLFTGGIRDWPYPVAVVAGRDVHTDVRLVAYLRRHSDFRGLRDLSTDVNRIIFRALTVHVWVDLVLTTRPRYPFAPHAWTVEGVACSDPDAPVDAAVRAAVERENRMIDEEWTPAMRATTAVPHVMMLTRLQRDIGAVLTM